MEALPLTREESFSPKTSSTQSPFETRTPTTDSPPSLLGVDTPDTEYSVRFSPSRGSSPSNSLPEDDFILVVGGFGYIGSHTSWELLQAGKNIIIIDNLSNSEQNVRDKLENLRDNHYKAQASWPILDFYQGDYRDRKLLQTIFAKYEDPLKSVSGSPSASTSKITGVIHFAGFKSVGESFKKPLDYYANNVCGLVDFCSTLSDFGIKTIVFSSSATVYGELANGDGRLLEEQCDNRTCAGLTNPYGRTKWMCEAILNDLAVSDPTWNITVLRYFNPIGCDESGVLGEEPRGTPNNLMPILVKVVSGELPVLNIFGTDWDTPDGTAIRDFIHVSDLAQGHLAALRTMKNADLSAGYHVYNLGSGTGHSVKEVVTAMENILGRLIPIHETERRQGDVGVCVAETSKSAVFLNWKTQKTLSQACRDICYYLGYIGERSASSYV